jgi:hypothetical protein
MSNGAIINFISFVLFGHIFQELQAMNVLPRLKIAKPSAGR